MSHKGLKTSTRRVELRGSLTVDVNNSLVVLVFVKWEKHLVFHISPALETKTEKHKNYDQMAKFGRLRKSHLKTKCIVF